MVAHQGWVASVALAAMTLRSGHDVDDVLDGFGRDGGLWFLIEEVLHELPDDTRSFLLDTCLPESCPADGRAAERP